VSELEPSRISFDLPELARQARVRRTPRLGGLRQRLKLPRRLRITRDGKYFIGITLGVGFAAINTGNNLLYLLLGMLLALIIVSGVLSETSLRKLTVVRRLPRRAQVGRPHLVEIAVHNHKRRIPSYAIEVEDLRAAQPADKRCFFLKIGPGSAQVAAYRRTPARRGRDVHVGFRLATRFPFGLFEKSRDIEAIDELIIYPAIEAVQLPAQGPARHQGLAGTMAKGHGDEIMSVRPMREGDDPRDIYWRKSTYELVLRERAQETQRHVELRIDPSHPDAPTDLAWREDFEARIRHVASRAVAHLKRGDTVTIRASHREHISANRSVGADPVLRFLALLEARPANIEGALPHAAHGRARLEA
jgi:uncharacterized protein (DUF58 family)